MKSCSDRGRLPPITLSSSTTSLSKAIPTTQYHEADPTKLTDGKHLEGLPGHILMQRATKTDYEARVVAKQGRRDAVP
jgi:hypothetical protein